MVDKFDLRFWNGFYYCKVQFPDGSKQELKSKEDLTFGKWKEKAEKTWEDSQNPEPEPDECQCPKCNAVFVCENRGI